LKYHPRISIGLPVFNGEVFLQEVLDSILSQSYPHFELIISDNASTDNTGKICVAYQAKDARIRYIRNPENMGAAWNYNRLVHVAKGEYFKWAAHDDLYHEDFLLKCIAVLDQNPDSVLCFSHIVDIDENGKFIRRNDHSLNTQSMKPYRRFHDLLCRYHTCLQVFGLIRTACLTKTRLIENYAGSDRALLAELSLVGRFIEIPEILFLHMEHKRRSTRANPTQEPFSEWFDPGNRNRISLPNWRLIGDYIRSAIRGPISWKQHIICLFSILIWIGKNKRSLFSDVANAWIKLKNQCLNKTITK
jgi:glycosyltransferase involved in cell wall biosynthesis